MRRLKRKLLLDHDLIEFQEGVLNISIFKDACQRVYE
ncbi:hypothetical protein MCBB_1496 [Methanobacterium congolense]|uniref:Uncharacterized protein n=1 Tax=Methanobacterium congolense TaxID=118062 RepID=A0A1D3L359_9EURY|nr:hypothetical protein MCBB_1496 [Methanobacterium congolense]